MFYLFNAYLYYFALILLAIIAFLLNRSSRYEVAKLLLLVSILMVIIAHSIFESVAIWNYFNLFPLAVAGLALFDSDELHKGIIFAAISLSVFVIAYMTQTPAFPGSAGPSLAESSKFLIHYIVALGATSVIVIFLIHLNRLNEKKLLVKDQNLNKATDQLKASQQRFELAINGSNAGIYDWDITKNVVYLSPKWKQLLGYAPHELDNFSLETFYEFVHPDEVSKLNDHLRSHLEDGTKYAIELRLKTKNNAYQWFSDAGQAIWNDAGEPVRMVGSIVKIHDRKVAEERIKKQNRMLEKTNLELDNFVYSTSHDIRSPLTSILGLINIASKAEDKHELEECLELMKGRVHRLDEFVEDILDFSRNMRLDKKLREINLLLFIDEILNQQPLGDQLEHVDISLQISPEFEIISDPLRLKVIIKNLISNAVKFSNQRGERSWLRISASHEKDLIKLSFEDNGEGIKPELLSRIFDMFFRGSERSQGSGLGLYISKEMVEKLNGNIHVKSNDGVGSTFTIELPDHGFFSKGNSIEPVSWVQAKTHY